MSPILRSVRLRSIRPDETSCLPESACFRPTGMTVPQEDERYRDSGGASNVTYLGNAEKLIGAIQLEHAGIVPFAGIIGLWGYMHLCEVASWITAYVFLVDRSLEMPICHWVEMFTKVIAQDTTPYHMFTCSSRTNVISLLN